MSPALTGRVLSTTPPEKSDKLIFKFGEKGKEFEWLEQIWKRKIKLEGLLLPDFKTSKAIAIKTIWHMCKDTLPVYSQLIFNKCAMEIYLMEKS